MSDFAILKKDELGTERVVNKIVSEYPFAQQLVLNGEADRAVQLFGDSIAEVGIGWAYDPATGVFTPPYDAMTVAEAKAQRKKDLAKIRYAIQTGGTTIGGAPVLTDPDSVAALTGAALQVLVDPEYTLNWKGVDGWVTLSGDQIKAFATAVRAFWQAQFDHNKALDLAIDAIDNATGTIEQVLAVTW
jgi:hypothetical protein